MMAALIGELAEGFILLVALPYRPEIPGLLKVSYDQRLQGPINEGGTARRVAARGYLLFNRLLSSLGLMGPSSTSSRSR